MKGIKGLCLALCALLTLSGCSVLEVEGKTVSSAPILQTLSMPPYQDREAPAAAAIDAEGNLRVDLWLDASQLMGGINESSDSLYAHNSRKYRQGGFHYRFAATAGWYEDVLQDMLVAAGDARTRVLRAGNERLTDAFLQSRGFTGDEAALRSYRRDMLTYAIDPMPDLFAAFSSDSMEDSFYSLGSPQMNQMARFEGDNGALLENPGQASAMSAALNEFIDGFHQKKAAPPEGLSAVGDDQQSPLWYALQNIDLSRLSVITCDPAALRRLNGPDTAGAPVNYIEALLRERGVFDEGLTVGLYAMRLDYLGQMTSFGAADFSDPLIWGRLNYNNKTQKTDSALPMPRVLLALVVGEPRQVEAYTNALNACLDEDEAFQAPRGPDKGQLCYTAKGETVTQQPFQFEYRYTDVARPSAGYYSQHTEGGSLTVADGAVTREDGLFMAELDLGESEKAVSQLVYAWPAAALEDGVGLELSSVTNARVEVVDALLLSGTLPNAPDTAVEVGGSVQTLALRDKLYLFSYRESPYQDDPASSPFTLDGLRWSEDGATLLATVNADRAKLSGGYYRLRIVADVSGEQVSWPAVDWTQDDTGLSVEVTSAQITEWESFMQVLTQYGRERGAVPKQFDHAWGAVVDKPYQGVDIPDFPPVYQALYLNRLFTQIRQAANLDTAPFIRCVFSVFIKDAVLP